MSRKDQAIRKRDAPYIVGVGASAGGIEAFQELLARLDDSLNLAIVFVQHLDPDSQSLLVDLLRKATSKQVVEITGRKKLKANFVYVCPPKKLLELKNGFIRIIQTEDDENPSNAIDHLFHSIAEDQTDHGIGVILSGAGSDGTLGLKAISDCGGLTFAQDPESAKYDSMPRNAATTGVADHVLPPDRIAEELASYVQYLDSVQSKRSPTQPDDEINEAIPTIAELLFKVTKHNFQHYKTTTLSRRIQRRMQILTIPSAADYVSYLQQHEEEVKALFRELLIGISAFFRDPDAFDALKTQVLPKVFEQRSPDDPIRIWIAGCANGSEAYTIAMLCREAMESLETTVDVQIFATDIDERALQIARAGSYPVGIEEHVSPDRLKRYFFKRGNKYKVKKDLRELVLFSAHNLISDPPFSRQDLIVCRNLLIYLDSHLQNKLIPLFHYALKPNGYLFLGPSENIASHTELFRSVDARHRISQRKGTAARTAPTLGLSQVSIEPREAALSTSDQPVDLTAMAQRIVLDEFAPAYAIIDESAHILNSSADLQKYIQIQGGDYQNNLIRMVHSDLRIGLRATLREAINNSRKVQHDHLSIRYGDRVQRMMLTVQPMPGLGEEEHLYMVVFHELGLPAERTEGDAPDSQSDSDADSLISQLESELQTTRRDLEKSMQDMEAGNEELKSSNEELRSMNEELQSANEELETSKEEIRASSDAVERANTDLQNVLRSTQIATIFLDAEGEVQWFSPAANTIYNLIATDIGRPLRHITHNALTMPPIPGIDTFLDGHNDEPLAGMTHPGKGSTANGQMVEHEVQLEDGRWFLRRVMPFLREEQPDGLILTFIDLTEQKRFIDEIHERDEQIVALMNSTAEGIYGIDSDGNCTFANASCARLLGYSDTDELVGRQMHELIHHSHADGTAYASHDCRIYESYRTGQRIHSDDEVFWRANGTSFDVEYWSYPVIRDGHTVGCVVTFLDATARRQWQQELSSREAQLRRVIDNTIAFVGVLDVDGTLREANSPALHVARMTRDEAVGKKFWDLPWWNFDPAVQLELQELIRRAASGESIRCDMKYCTLDQVRALDFMLNPVTDDDGKVTHLIPSGIDIHDRKQAETELLRAKQRLDLSLEFSDVAPWNWDIKRSEVISNPILNRLFGFEENAAPRLAEFIERIEESARDRVARAVEDSVENGETFDQEYSINLPDGSLRHVRARGLVLTSSDGDLLDFYGVVADITSRKQREMELADREAHLRRVINNQLGLVGVIDRDGILLEIDDHSLAIAQTRREDVVGKHFVDAPWWNYDPAVADQMRDAMQRALAGEVVRYDVSLFAHGAEGVMIDFMIAPVRNEKGDVEYLIPSGVDIRERKAAEIALEHRARVSELHTTLAIELAQGESLTETLQAVCQMFVDVLDVAFARIWLRHDHESDLRLTASAGIYTHLDGDHAVIPVGKFKIGRIAQKQVPLLTNDVAHDPNISSPDWAIREGMTAFAGYPLVIADQTIGVLAMFARHEMSDVEFEQLGPMSIAIAQYVDRMQKARKLAHNANRLELSIRAGNMAAWEWTESKSYWEPKLFELLGIEPVDNPNSELFFERVHPDDLPRLRSDWQRAAAGKAKYDTEFRIIRPDGDIRWLAALGTVTYSEDNRVVSMHGLNWDITEEKEYKQNLDTARKQAEAASQSKSAFVANMSHEIRTPMTAILGYAEMLREHITDREARQHLQIIRRNGEYLLEIINDILDLSKIEAGKLEICLQQFDPARIIDDVRRVMAVRAKESSLDFQVEYQTRIPARIKSDPKRLKQILINLVGNAIKFTREGSVDIGVRYLEDSILLFEIRDTGIGMSSEQQTRLFKPFSQADPSITRHFGGTGLGLAISRRLAEMLHGTISVTSELGNGSIFTFSLPIGELTDVEMVKPAAKEPEVDDTDFRTDHSVRLDCHVLVVDDRRDVRFLSTRILTKAGATVDEAEDGQIAVDRITEGLQSGSIPDLILLDMQMPNLDGYETARQLRAIGYTNPIIALTADAMQGDMTRCLESGCNDYLSKPIDAQKLTEMVNRFTP